MTDKLNNINNLSAKNNILPAVKVENIEKHLNKNKNSKLLVLNLDDLNTDIINQLKEKQCKMRLLNNNFTIVEEGKSNQVQHIQITIDGYKQPIAIENIIRFEANGNYTYIHIKNHTKPILTSRTLKHYVDLLDKSSFIRPHSKHLVNLSYITGLANLNAIDLDNGTSLPVSRRRWSYVKKVILNR